MLKSFSFSAPETPSKSLVGTNDASMLFSPPSILKETLPDDSGTGMDAMHTTPPPGTSHGSGMGYSGGKPSPKSKVIKSR